MAFSRYALQQEQFVKDATALVADAEALLAAPEVRERQAEYLAALKTAQEAVSRLEVIANPVPPGERANEFERLLGVPDSDTGQLIAWGNRMVGNTDPEHADVLIGSADSDEYRHVPFRSPAAIEVYEYGRHLAAERRGKGGTDLVTLLADGVPGDGVPLSEHEFNTNFLLLVVAVVIIVIRLLRGQRV